MRKVEMYSIGTSGKKWGSTEKQQWLSKQTVKRSYKEDVVSKIVSLSADFKVIEYGSLPYNDSQYPLYLVLSKNWDSAKPTIVITGGVHGYETSGVQGAIRFLNTKAVDYIAQVNFIVAPCVSPWGYETINRWNPNAIDPNRSFYQDSPAQESALLMSHIDHLSTKLGFTVTAHFDLHETTDTDNSEFRPALASRDAIEQKSWNIPDGFYLVGDSLNPVDAFQTAVIEEVQKVTHIAPADENNQLIGVQESQFGVINYPVDELGLCAGLTNAKYRTTTEVYPDSPLVDDENCILAQVAAVVGGLNYLLR